MNSVTQSPTSHHVNIAAKTGAKTPRARWNRDGGRSGESGGVSGSVYAGNRRPFDGVGNAGVGVGVGVSIVSDVSGGVGFRGASGVKHNAYANGMSMLRGVSWRATTLVVAATAILFPVPTQQAVKQWEFAIQRIVRERERERERERNKICQRLDRYSRCQIL